MTALLKTRLKVVPLILLFVGFQDLGWVLRNIALSIGVRDTYINNAICATSPKAAKLCCRKTKKYFARSPKRALAMKRLSICFTNRMRERNEKKFAFSSILVGI